MADMDEEIIETPDTEEEIIEEEIEESSDDEITYEQAMKWKEDLKKASKKISDLKKSTKTIKATKNEDNPVNSREELEKFYAEKEFFKNNPEAEAYKEKMGEYKGLSLDEQYLLASRKDKEIEQNREIYGESFVKGEVNKESLTTVSIDTFDRMTSKAQEDYTNKMTGKYGKVKFK